MYIISKTFENMMNLRTTQAKGSNVPIWLVQRKTWVPNMHGEGEDVIIDDDGNVYRYEDLEDLMYEHEETFVNIKEGAGSEYGVLTLVSEIMGFDGVFNMEEEWEFSLENGEVFLTLESARQRIPKDNDNVRLYCVSAWRDPHMRQLDNEWESKVEE